MTTPFSVEETARATYPHAITIQADGGRSWYVFVGNVYPLTAKRKRAIGAALCEARGIPLPTDMLGTFDRTPFGRDTDYRLTWETITNNATGEVRETFSYRHTMGSGHGHLASGLHVITID